MTVGYKPMSFSKVREIVDSGNIRELYRSPECMKKYNSFKKMLKDEGIDMTSRIVVEQLHWLPPSTSIRTPSNEIVEKIKPKDSTPFANEDDITIVTNSFPYYLEDGLVHLCAWVKFPMPPDPKSELGDISDEMKRLVNLYVKKTFVDHLGLSNDKVLWFKNWAALQSIKTIPHIHVILDHPNPKKVQALLQTGGIPIDYSTDFASKL